MNRAGRLWAMLRWGFTALGMWMILISCTPLTYWYATWLAGSWEDARGEVLIVLSASAGPHGMLAADSHHRAEYAVLAWRGGGFRKVVVCGKGAAGPIRDFLILSGVPADAVVLENESNSTRENALFAARVLEQEKGRKVLLTSDFHMFRAYRAFTRVGVVTLPRPVPDARQRWHTVKLRWGTFLDLAEESGKIVYYKIRGWM